MSPLWQKFLNNDQWNIFDFFSSLLFQDNEDNLISLIIDNVAKRIFNKKN